jgi:hypothetical protein
LNHQIKKDETGRECSTHGGEVQSKFWWENMKDRDQQHDLEVDGRIILKIISKNKM